MLHHNNSNTTSWRFHILSAFTVLVFLGMACLAGCDKSDPPPALEVSPEPLTFPFSGGEASFTVTSNISWTVSCESEGINDPDWLVFSTLSGTGDGTVTVTAAENILKSRRTATVTVSGEDITHTISVTQDAFVPSLTVSEDSLSFPYSKEQKSFSITSNTSWKVSSSESWLSVSPASGYGEGTVTASSAINYLTADRTATINVKQEKSPLSVSVNELSFPSESSEKKFTIRFNSSWTVSCYASWLTISPDNGNGDGTISVKADTNSSTTERTATITVRAGVFSEKISVTQAGGPLSISPSLLYFASGGDEKTVSVYSNTSWTVRSNASWLTVSPASGSGDGTVKAKARANSSISDRTATITVSAGGISENISVTQSGISTGSAMFWIKSDFGCGFIRVTLNGETKTIMGYYYQGSPWCGDTYTATFPNLPYGSYSYTASCSGRSWSGTITVDSKCNSIRLD